MIPRHVAARARELRAVRHRTAGGGPRLMPWPQVRAELAREGLGWHQIGALVDAVQGLPLGEAPDAPPSAAELARIEESWRAGWALERPGQPWPGLSEARRQLQGGAR